MERTPWLTNADGKLGTVGPCGIGEWRHLRERTSVRGGFVGRATSFFRGWCVDRAMVFIVTRAWTCRHQIEIEDSREGIRYERGEVEPSQ